MSIGSIGGGINQFASNLFSKIDTKQQGYFDQEGLAKALNGSSASDSSTQQLFTQLDGDSDGRITESELSSGLQSLADTLLQGLQESRLQGVSHTASEGDAGFTKEELSALAGDSKTDSRAADLFSRLADNFADADANSDGRITQDEAISYDQQHNSTASARPADSTSDSLTLIAKMLQLLNNYGVTEKSGSSAGTGFSATA